MEIIDEKTITLKDGEKDLKIRVYIKEVLVRNNFKSKKAFCKIVD